MKIAIIGTGNVGAALATKWAETGHEIALGVRNQNNFKGKQLLNNPNTSLSSMAEAVEAAEVILLATPATATIDVCRALGDTSEKIILDAMNTIKGRGADGYTNTADAILAHTNSQDVVKCFNTTGFNVMVNPEFNGLKADMFCCGDSVEGKKVAQQLALDAGFEACYDIGGNDKFQLIEQFAYFWINLALFQGQGREIAFKLMKR